MRTTIATIILLLSLSAQGIKAAKTEYYFDSTIAFDAAIPSPEAFLGYEIGSRVTEHSRINAYFEKLASLSDKTSLVAIGRTHEHRTLYVLIVSSPGNIKKLDQLRDERPLVRRGEQSGSPLIVFLGNTVHGNEISSSEAAMLVAYYFVASQSEAVRQQLEDGIYFIDPVRNPDGQERFASWINSNASVNVYNTSPYDREHTEGWPRGRGNHYWFDLNRDWVNTVHPESKARVAHYQQWLPHVQADHHEMGTNTSFFFEPTDPNGTESRFVPASNYQLNRLFADYFANALNKIGSLYYTKETYDNKNPNFGSTYPDYNGGLGILFEQGSSRGLQQESENGIVTLPFTVRNQLVTSIATVDAANAHKKKLFDLQKEFFTPVSSAKESATSYIIGDNHDLSRLHKFIQLLLDHRLEVYENPADITIGSVRYEKGKSYLIPLSQPNRALTGIIFDEKKDYTNADHLSFGAGFSVAYASGLSYTTTNSRAKGKRVEKIPAGINTGVQRSDYAYLVDYRDSKSQQLLFRLLESELKVKAATRPFSVNTDAGVRDFSYGSLLIPVQNQSIGSAQLHALLQQLSATTGVVIVAVGTGFSHSGVDLGSSSFRSIGKPKVLVITGGDIVSTEAGEVWHLFDQQLAYPLTRVDYNVFRRVALHEFNRIVLVSGSYSFLDKSDLENLSNWVKNGGTLITINEASRWAAVNQLSSIRVKEAVADSLPTQRNRRIPTSVFQTKIDLKHPLAFGLTSEYLPVAREGALFLAPSSHSVSAYTDDPLLNGYIAPGQLSQLKSSASIAAVSSGRGQVILFAGNPLFRGIWDATSRTFVNAIVFGNIVPEQR